MSEPSNHVGKSEPNTNNANTGKPGKTYTLELDEGERRLVIDALVLLGPQLVTESPTRLALLARLEALDPHQAPSTKDQAL